METTSDSAPAFGAADLSNCEREQIHQPGSVQPHGALLVCRGDHLEVIHASANLGNISGIDREPFGLPLSEFQAQLAETVNELLAEDGLDQLSQSLRCHITEPPRDFDVAVHRLSTGEVIVELESVRPSGDLTAIIEKSFRTIVSSLTLRELCDDTARVFKELSGYDRVMVYRFDQDGHGEVFSECRESELEPFLGNRYPASDIPQIARRLYERNRIRLMVDVEYEPVPLITGADAYNSDELDMSLCSLRSVSPIHVQYLKNMGVTGTLVVSLMVGGSLWGLISCHHYRPRNIAYETKTACEVLAEMVATRIAALESFVRAETELSVRRIEQRIIEAIARDGDWKSVLFDKAQVLLQPLKASGAAITYEGQVLSTGEVPGTQQIRSIAQWLEKQSSQDLYATSSLGLDESDFASFKQVGSGLIAVPISRSPGEYLFWFRPERIRTVTWGGNPFKPVEVGDDPKDLSPRRSFSQWHQVVEGTSDHWSTADLATARLIGESIEDVVYQFRAVRMLIAQDQLAQIKRDVRGAHQPVVVADASGRLLLVNNAFYNLAKLNPNHLASIEDLPPLFKYPAAVNEMLQVLVRDQQSWRGEVLIEAQPGEDRTLMLRADPVFSEVDRILGFVLFFAEITDQKEIERVRRDFQENVIVEHQKTGPQLDEKNDLLFHDLLSNVESNAKLAALEISEGMDMETVPKMLDSVRASVSRTGNLLRHLLSRL